MKKYLTRALKFYVFLLVLITLVILLLALVGFADLTNINTLFRNGFNAVWEIALIFLVVAAIYPKIGFSNRDMTLRGGSWDEVRTNMLIAMGDRGYKLESEDGKVFTFRKRWFINRLAKYTEDRITITRVSGFDAAERPEEQAAGSAAEAATPQADQTAAGGADAYVTDSAAAGSEYGHETAAGAEDGGQETVEVQTVQESGNGESGRMNRYTINIEGLTKDIVRIVSALYRIQSRSTDE